MPTEAVVRLGPIHADILEDIRGAITRFLDVEGALRSAKTWTVLAALRMVLDEQPGIKMFMARWTEDGLNQKLIPDYRLVCQLMRRPEGKWNAQERAFDFGNGSRLFALYLKSQEKSNRYKAVRGLTVARGYIDQPEEMPEDVFDETALRLSQPGYSQQLVVSPNPVQQSHWLARKKFPEDNSKPLHRYVHLSIWDNKHNLDPATIQAAETLYPVGHPQRRVKLEGLRGLDVTGTPVYAGAFNRGIHVQPDNIPLNPSLELIEVYDYGFHHPCVTWHQWAPWGIWYAMGGLLGVDMHLDTFLPIVQKYRELWFPRRTMLLSGGDPAGAAENSQGLKGKPIEILRDWYRQHGDEVVSPQFQPDANQPEQRNAANKLLASYMMSRAYTGEPCFQVDPDRWMLVQKADTTSGPGAHPLEERFDSFFIDALEAGYVLEDEPRHSSRLGTYWVPKKDGFYEHPMNTTEYAGLLFVRAIPIGEAKQPKTHETHINDAAIKQALAARRALREQQRDDHPQDRVPVAARSLYGAFRGRVN